MNINSTRILTQLKYDADREAFEEEFGPKTSNEQLTQKLENQILEDYEMIIEKSNKKNSGIKSRKKVLNIADASDVPANFSEYLKYY